MLSIKDTSLENSVRLKDDPDIGRLVMSAFSWNHYAARRAVYGLRYFFVSAQWAKSELICPCDDILLKLERLRAS